MIENPVIQFIVVLLFGFCLGILFMIWYILHMIAVLSLRTKIKELTYKEIINIVIRILSNSIKEVELAKKKRTNEYEEQNS